MITVTCKYADGDTITTRFNGTPDDARAYFVGQTFNIGSVDDNMQRCVSITIEEPPAGAYVIKVDGEEIDHADTRAEAKRARNTIIYGEIGTEANTTIERRPESSSTMSDIDLATVTPIGIKGSKLTHATTAIDPISTTVVALCGRSMKVTSTYSVGTFDQHARNTVIGFQGGACRLCLKAAGLSPRPAKPHDLHTPH